MGFRYETKRKTDAEWFTITEEVALSIVRESGVQNEEKRLLSGEEVYLPNGSIIRRIQDSK